MEHQLKCSQLLPGSAEDLFPALAAGDTEFHLPFFTQVSTPGLVAWYFRFEDMQIVIALAALSLLPYPKDPQYCFSFQYCFCF